MAITKITGASIAADSIDGTKIADDAINSEHLTDGGIDDVHIGDVAATKLTGTIASARLSASNLGSGTVPTARLGSGTADTTTFLRGDGSWQVVSVPKLDSPVISGTLSVLDEGNVTHTISNWSDDVSYTITPTNCTVGSINNSGEFVVTHTSGAPSYTIVATTASLGLDDSATVTKNITMQLTAPTLSSPDNSQEDTDVVYTITSTTTADDKLILDFGASTFTYESVSVGSGSKVGNTVEVTGFTTNNPAVTVQFTAEATYSVTAKSTKIDGSYGDSASSSADSITILNYTFDPASPFETGDGVDGSVSGTLPAQVTDYVTTSPSSGTDSVTLNDATGFSVGNQVLLIQMRKNAGLSSAIYEMIAVSGINSNTLTFSSNLQNSYAGTTANYENDILIVKVPRYTNVTISNTSTVTDWYSPAHENGIWAFKATGTVAITSTLTAEGAGFRGGASNNVGYGTCTRRGDSQMNEASYGCTADGIGGGAGKQNTPSVAAATAGAGGGHATSGQNGNVNGVGGGTWGGQDLTSHLGFGGGGGAGAYDYSQAGGNGGKGGGVIMIMADTVTISGSGAINADGDDGLTGAKGGGGGAGGSIYIKATTLTTNGAITAIGGTGGEGPGEDAGDGGTGRIHFQVSGTTTGSSTPAAYTG